MPRGFQTIDLWFLRCRQTNKGWPIHQTAEILHLELPIVNPWRPTTFSAALLALLFTTAFQFCCVAFPLLHNLHVQAFSWVCNSVYDCTWMGMSALANLRMCSELAFRKAKKDCQTGVIISTHKKGDRRKCTNCQCTSFLNLLEKAYASCLEKHSARKKIETKLECTQCSFALAEHYRPNFHSQSKFPEIWVYAKDVYVFCRSRKSIWPGPLWKALGSFAGVRCWPPPVLTPLVCVNWTDSRSRFNEGVTSVRCTINRLLFSGDLVLPASSERGFRVSTCTWSVFNCVRPSLNENQRWKNEVLFLWGSACECMLQASGNTLQQVEKFKQFRVVFANDWRQNNEMNTRICKANTVLCELYRSVVTKRELSNIAKLSAFKPVFVNLYVWSCILDNNRKIAISGTSSKDRIFAKSSRVTLSDEVGSFEIRKTLNVKPFT